VSSADASNNTTASSDGTFTTTAVPREEVVVTQNNNDQVSRSSSGGRVLNFAQYLARNTSQTTANFNRNLSTQDFGPDVRSLQSFLITKGFLAVNNDTGYFGPLTRSALSKYQVSVGISPAVGYFGPVTRAYIVALAQKTDAVVPVIPATELGYPARDLSLGMSGEDVRSLQKYLNSHGFKVAESGPGSPGMETDFFGSGTRNALVQFQKSQNIFPSVGYFGPITREIIYAK
jgi:peptidoglycan hydrolase-like protein with peptidoglycan-binding domain